MVSTRLPLPARLSSQVVTVVEAAGGEIKVFTARFCTTLECRADTIEEKPRKRTITEADV